MNNFVTNTEGSKRAYKGEFGGVKNSCYSSFFDLSPLASVICSLDGVVQISNKAWDQLLSNSLADHRPLNILLDSRFNTSDFKKAFQHTRFGDAARVPAFYCDPIWLEAITSAVKDDSGKVSQIAVVFVNVTEKSDAKKALVTSLSEKKLAEEKAEVVSGRLNMALKAGNIGIWEWLPNSSHVYLDETAEKLFGVTQKSFKRSSDIFAEAIHPEDLDFFWSTVSRALIERRSYKIDVKVPTPEGRQRWIQLSGMSLYDDQNKPTLMMGTVIDITEKIESEADQRFLSQASELLNGSLDYREILKALSDHAINYFCDGVFIDQLLADGEMKRLMVVHSNPEVVKTMMKMDDLLPDRYENNPAMNTIISGKSTFSDDVDQFWASMRETVGEQYYETAIQLEGKSSIWVRMKGRESILGTISFFTQKNSSKVFSKRHIWLSEELAYRASMAFENALIHQASQDAIKTRDEFLSIASHELKTPLQSLTLQNQMRKRNLDKNLLDSFRPEKISNMIDADLRHLMRINRLIDDMLDISRIRAGKLTFIKEKTDFCAFAKDVLERFRPQIESVGSYLSVVYCEPMMVNIDVYRTEQVLVNLLTNAVKYGGGKPIKVEILKKLDKIQVQIHDKGPGIKEEDCERIFERFERAISSSEVSGMGLGLYISRQIMEQNQGSLYVRSILGIGSTFIMELPFDS